MRRFTTFKRINFVFGVPKRVAEAGTLAVKVVRRRKDRLLRATISIARTSDYTK